MYFIPIFLLAVFLFSGCLQTTGSEETPVLPETPQNIQIKPGNERLIVSWDEAEGASSYELVWDDGENELSKENAAARVVVDGLENGKPYSVKVRSKNSVGLSDFSSPEEGIPAIQGPTPSVIRGDSELSIGWDAETGVKYEVGYGTDSAAASQWDGPIIGSGIVAGTTITGLTNGTTYYVWIKITDKELLSEETIGTPAAPPEEVPPGFEYVSGGTVAGSDSYTMTVTVPSVAGYMNAGKTLTKKGVFVEGRTVSIDSFYMARYETTRKLWYEVQFWAESKGYSFQNRIAEPKESDENKPISNINWRDAIVWCNAYSEKSGLEPVYYYQGNVLQNSRDANGTACDAAVMDKSKNGFRLPTEAEREFAARGGDPGKADWMFIYSGSNDANEAAWHHGNSPYTVRDAGGKKPNRLGIYDLSGNVQEWGWDWMNYNIAVTADTDPDGKPYGSPYIQKTMAGGGVGSNITMSCVADRWGYITSYKDQFIGFRVMRKAN